MSVIRITVDFGGAQVSIRECLHASIASGQPLSGRKLHTRVPLGIPVCSTSSLAARSCQTPDATITYLLGMHDSVGAVNDDTC